MTETRVSVWMSVLTAAYAGLFLAANAVSEPLQRSREPSREASAEPPGHSAFAGSAKCGECHQAEYSQWRRSHHAAAMQAASDETVLGDFDGARFKTESVESRFFKRNGKFFVTTDGPDGKLADFEIRYTFGIYPLQQYLIALPGGRLQALGIAWDARPKSAGGRRWFHLYPDRTLKAGDRLHWTGADQNWNYQCAACHSTNLKKSYDPETNAFATTWSEISVGCESCHGPGANHIAWTGGKSTSDPLKGFAKRLDERHGITWVRGADHTARRSHARTTSNEIETCAACHSRREQFSDEPNVRFLDAFRPSLIEAGLYHADGQQRDEVFTYGSFAESRMHAAGVTCSDCHEPHSGKLRAEGNALCGQCHAADTFDTANHHRHAAGSTASQCVSCHMPATVYMGVDARRDHSFRIPRPDFTHTLGTPNACQTCHQDKSAMSLAAAIKSWVPNLKPGFQSFADLFDRADRGAPGTEAGLTKLIGDASEPAIARGSALARLTVSPRSSPVILEALRDPEATVRLAAVEALGRSDLKSAQHHVAPLLSDPARAVRMAAARALAGPGESGLDARARGSFEAALKEYIAAQEFNAERPEQQLNLAGLYMALGQVREARTALDRALAIDPAFAPAHVLTAELERGQGDEAAAERALRQGLERSPGSAELTHALGLSLIRQKRAEAVRHLVAAAQTAPEAPRYAYVAAIALKDVGQKSEAVALLEAGLLRHPYDRDLLHLLALLYFEAGDVASARKHLERLLELEPENANLAALLATLKRGPD